MRNCAGAKMTRDALCVSTFCCPILIDSSLSSACLPQLHIARNTSKNGKKKTKSFKTKENQWKAKKIPKKRRGTVEKEWRPQIKKKRNSENSLKLIRGPSERKKERETQRQKEGRKGKEIKDKKRKNLLYPCIYLCMRSASSSFPNAMEGRRCTLIFVLDYGLRPYIA